MCGASKKRVTTRDGAYVARGEPVPLDEVEDDAALVLQLPDRALVVGVAADVDFHRKLLVENRGLRAHLHMPSWRQWRQRGRGGDRSSEAHVPCGGRTWTVRRVGVIVTVRSRAAVSSGNFTST